ncbi:MAG TPA: helix-turn-helix domain-containing protein [Thermoanaerobaculia bacterium]
MSSAKRGRGRPRREGADEEILAVARVLLEERGYRDLSVDEVAERAGVAKTTVYRRWPSKGALAAAALTPAPIATSAEELLRDTRALLAPFADAEDDAEILGVLRAILGPRRHALASMVGNPDELLGAIWMELFIPR